MRHTGTQTLETKRLVLRRFAAGDAEVMYQNWASDALVARYVTWNTHAGPGETRAILEGWVAAYSGDDFYLWAVTQREDATLIGSIGVHHNPNRFPPHEWEPGYCIGRPWWGRGYTTEALRAVMDYVLPILGPGSLCCCHASANPASGAVMQKVGFVYHHDGVMEKADGRTLPAKYYVFRRQ